MPASPLAIPKAVSRQSPWWLMAALAPFAIVEASRWHELPAMEEADYAQYLLHAKALVEGRPYSDIGYIYTPLNFVGPQVQPPGWPLVLAPFVAVFGTDLTALRPVIVLIVASAAVVAGMIVARRRDVAAGVVAGLAALSLQSQRATASLLSDPLFCLITWTALLVADHDGRWGWRRAIGLALLCAAALSVRVAGAALLPALLAWMLFRAGDQRWRMGIPVFGVVGVTVGVMTIATDHVPFVSQIDFGAKFSFYSMRAFVLVYSDAFLNGTLYPLPWNGANDAYHVAAAPIVLAGAIRLIREGATFVWFFVLAYSVLLYVAPVLDPRYAWPLLPVLIWCLIEGLTWMFTALRGRWAGIPRTGPAMLAGMIALAAALRLLGAAPLPSLQDDPDTRDVFGLVRSANTISPVRVVFPNPRVLTLETGVPAMGFPHGTPEVVLEELRDHRITHVVIRRDGPVGEIEAPLVALASSRHDLLPEIFANGSYSVRRVSWTGQPAPR